MPCASPAVRRWVESQSSGAWDTGGDDEEVDSERAGLRRRLASVVESKTPRGLWQARQCRVGGVVVGGLEVLEGLDGVSWIRGWVSDHRIR